jgi:UDP-N-acetyl-D-glucosamine dehydrogenase
MAVAAEARRSPRTTTADHLVDAIHARKARIGVVGLGYVGLPAALGFSEAGFKVTGFDNDPMKIARLGRGQSYIGHVAGTRISDAAGHGFEASGDLGRIGEADALILCLPTPLNAHREPDLRFVLDTVDSMAPHLRAGQVVCLESTTYPGTTEEELLPRLEAGGLRVGTDIFLVYSPEREDPGNTAYRAEDIPRVVGGVTGSCARVGVALYAALVREVVPVSSARTAELTKLLENIHRAVNIGLVNELKIVADRMGIDIHEVIRAAATKPFGFVPYQPGPGLGGHCIPIDPFYLTWKARQFGVNTRFIELAGEVNAAMPDFVIGKLTEALNRARKPVNGARVLVLGLAYKPNVDDTRESASVVLMEKLARLGAIVAYSDPHVPEFPPMRDHRFDLASLELTAKTLAAQDCVLLATDHDGFDYDLIARHAKLIVDTRGHYREPADHIVRA